MCFTHLRLCRHDGSREVNAAAACTALFHHLVHRRSHRCILLFCRASSLLGLRGRARRCLRHCCITILHYASLLLRMKGTCHGSCSLFTFSDPNFCLTLSTVWDGGLLRLLAPIFRQQLALYQPAVVLVHAEVDGSIRHDAQDAGCVSPGYNACVIGIAQF